MPPKGWRKNNETVTPTAAKAVDPVPIDDLLFPKSTVNKLAKTVLDDHSLSKDSLLALQRAATVFVNHLYFFARIAARDAGRKSVNSQEVIQALENTEFASFIPIVQKELESYTRIQELKKQGKEKPEGEERAADEPVVKKARDNSGSAVDRVTTGDEAEESDTEQEGGDADGDQGQDPMEMEEPDEGLTQPLVALEQEEKELQGEEYDDREEESQVDAEEDEEE